MKSCPLLIVVLLIQICNAIVVSQNSKSVNNEEQLLSLIYDCQYEEAKHFVNELLNNEPQSLRWNFLRVMIDWRQFIVDAKTNYKINPSLRAKAENSLLNYKSWFDRLHNTNADTAEILFYNGAINGYIGIYYAGFKDEPMEAIRVGKAGLDYHEQLRRIYPTFYDTYYSLGVYHFYASAIPWYVKPFLYLFGKSGSEEEAVKCFTIAVEKGRLTKYEATEYLADLYERKQMLDSAKSQYFKLIHKFPNGRFLYYLLMGRMYENHKLNDDAIQLYKQSLEESKLIVLTNGNSDFVAKIYLSLSHYYEQRNLNGEAISLYTEALNRKLGYFEWLHFRLGNVYEKIGNSDMAVIMYKTIKGKELTEKGYSEVQRRLQYLERVK